ncbi:hypothetical protein EK904_007145 [Melospiza melodia maxima]|nr:hypothetical protein EK904_007145 [Melospiza melodia maxima]
MLKADKLCFPTNPMCPGEQPRLPGSSSCTRITRDRALPKANAPTTHSVILKATKKHKLGVLRNKTQTPLGGI